MYYIRLEFGSIIPDNLTLTMDAVALSEHIIFELHAWSSQLVQFWHHCRWYGIWRRILAHSDVGLTIGLIADPRLHRFIATCTRDIAQLRVNRQFAFEASPKLQQALADINRLVGDNAMDLSGDQSSILTYTCCI